MTRDDLVKQLEKAERRTNCSRGIAAALMLREAKNNLRLWDKAYAAGAKDEREACAHMVEDWDLDLACPRVVADAIRARGKK